MDNEKELTISVTYSLYRIDNEYLVVFSGENIEHSVDCKDMDEVLKTIANEFKEQGWD